MLRSKMSSWSRVACNRYSRESGRSGASRKASSRAYSLLAQGNRPFLRSVRRRLRRSSRHPSNLYSPCSTSWARRTVRSHAAAAQRDTGHTIHGCRTAWSGSRRHRVRVRPHSQLHRRNDLSDNDRDVRTGTNSRSDRAIALAEAQFENDRTWVLASQLKGRCRAAGRRDGLYAVLPEIIRDQVPYGGSSSTTRIRPELGPVAIVRLDSTWVSM